ncbi:MAG: DNA polymerase III subunit delta [Flavobacteriales bacterium]|nr:DNA polymerase III subunit delta [Flavobacteriales bacterium]
MDYKQILTDLKNKVYHPVYFLSGEEAYYIDIVANYIEENVLDDAEKEFNQTIVYGKETDMITIISEAKRYPMMANHNVVIVKEAQHLEKEIDQLEAYIENPTPSTILVFCYKYKTLDGRKGVSKKIKKQAVLLESKKLYDNQVPDWINGFLKSKKYTISPHASVLIAEFLGTDLSKVANELNKLIINVPAGTEITPDLVEKNIGISKDYNSFELNKAIGTKDVLKANKIVYHFAKNQKDNPLPMTIGILYNFFTNILNYHYAKDKSRNNIASLLKISPFFVQEYQVAANNYSIKKAVKVIEYLRDYDLKSKGVNNTSATSGDLLKELVFKIIH